MAEELPGLATALIGQGEHLSLASDPGPRAPSLQEVRLAADVLTRLAGALRRHVPEDEQDVADGANF